MASPVIQAGRPGHHIIEEYAMPRSFPQIGPAIQDEQVVHNGQRVVLREVRDYTPGAVQRYAIVRPDGELACYFERALALEIAADYFSHGAL